MDYTTSLVIIAGISAIVLLYATRFFHNTFAAIKDIREYGWAEHRSKVQRYMKHEEALKNIDAKYTKKGEIKMMNAMKRRK